MLPRGPSQFWQVAVRLAGPAPDTTFLPDFVADFREDEEGARRAFATLASGGRGRTGSRREVVRVELRAGHAGAPGKMIAEWPAARRHTGGPAGSAPQPFGQLLTRPVPTTAELDL